VHRLLTCLAASATLYASVLVSRSDKGLQFTDALSITINGKNKVLSLGSQPKITSPIGNLPSGRVGGTLLKDRDSNTIATYEQGSLEYILPSGLPKNTAPDPAAIWRTATISYRTSSSGKTAIDVPAEQFVAFLADGLAELTRICMDPRALEVIGGKGKAFPTQVELLSAAVKAYSSDPAMAPLKRYVEGSMRGRYEQFESGGAGVDVLAEGLKFAQLSQAAYPNDAEQDRLRKALMGRQAWLDRKIAILRALTAAGHWDAILLGFRDFEKYELAFPDMAGKHVEVLKQSMQYHREAAKSHLAEGDYGAAVRDLRAAISRQPSDTGLQEEARQAWTEYSRRLAIDRHGKREKLSAGQHDAVERHLFFADQNKQAKGLDEALKNVVAAESVLSKSLPPGTIAPESLRVQYKKAEILAAQGRISEALATLDAYDQMAVDEERQPANQLRNQFLFQLEKTLTDVKSQMQRAWVESQYHRVRDLCIQASRLAQDDAELLYNAGLSSLITRHTDEARAYLTHYLEVSDTLDANTEQRARARRVLPTIADTSGPEQGDVNWLSGKKLPKGVYYCPISLAFQPRVERIDASNRLKLVYEWDGDRLKSIAPVFEKNEHETDEKKISFLYDSGLPQVVSVKYENEPQTSLGADPDEAFKRFSVVLLNNRLADPIAIQKLTGKNVTIGISGNRFFNPFVWEKIYFFRLTYDDNGRVSEAHEMNARAGALTDLVLKFDWNELQLARVRGYQGADERRREQIYERTLQYQDGRLVSEEIQGQGKASRIRYNYTGNRIVSAICDKDLSLDGRSRQVTFLGNSPSLQLK